jgi:hypothetical protein
MKRLLLAGALVSAVTALALPAVGGAGVVTLRHIGDPFNGRARRHLRR